jgi:methylenetetrahydrofolate dehydrogenase (NADP+) / methenyltetrahydrofolate cyclohydrolase
MVQTRSSSGPVPGGKSPGKDTQCQWLCIALRPTRISHGSPEFVAPVSRPAVLRASRPSETLPDLKFWVVPLSVRNASSGAVLLGAMESDTMRLGQTMARILDGAAIAAAIKEEVAEEVRGLAAQGIQPGLAAVLVGNVAASEIYVRSKVQTCADLGLFSELITPSSDITTEAMLDLVRGLNDRDEIDGILIQLPLPAQVDAKALLDAVDPAKDVDGFHPVNAGRLQAGRPALAPCTPAGVIEILKRSGVRIAGQHAVVVGRSDIVGKPLAMLLLHQNATVTICHSKTRDLSAVTREADILVAAIGRPGFITAEMVKPGATIVDVGINRITERADFDRYFAGNARREAAFMKRGSTIVGDVHPLAFELAGAYTPVPGGVGPLTIAMLMANTVRAAKMRRGL